MNQKTCKKLRKVAHELIVMSNVIENKEQAESNVYKSLKSTKINFIKK